MNRWWNCRGNESRKWPIVKTILYNQSCTILIIYELFYILTPLLCEDDSGFVNECFTWAFTHRIIGPLSLLFHTNGSIHGTGLTTCPATKRNEDPCGRPLKDYGHLIESPSHGFRFYLHSKLEDVIYACYRDAFRIELTEGKADVCKNDDKRKDNPGNLLTSIAAEGSQPDGVTAYGHYLDRDEFPIFRRERVPFLVRMWIA